MRILIHLLYLRLVFSLEPLIDGWERREDVKNDFDVVPFPEGDDSPRLVSFVVNSTVPSTGRAYTMYVGLLRNGLPDAFSLELPTGGCCHRNKTSETAKAHNCSYATNGGFFNTKNGCCVGNLVTNSKLIQVSSQNRVNFGLLKVSHMMGYMTEELIRSKDFLQLITGAGWLIRNGSSYINESKIIEVIPETFVSEKAPRTAMGVASNGSLYLIQVDGEEDIKAGLDLYEFAEVITKLGLQEAVNLDGGGSSVSVKDGKVIDKPTCIDTSFVCERPVTSITCMHDS